MTPATVVPKFPMPITLADLTGRLASGYVDLYGKMPGKDLLAFAAAMNGVENGGGANINNGNVGNITVPGPESPTGRVWEANGLRFIAFDAISEGVVYWWEFMRARYGAVLLDGAMGSPEAAVRDLFRLGYLGSVTTPAQEEAYRKGVLRYLAQTEPFARKITGYTARPYVGAAVGGGAVVVLAALSYFGGAK